jgi:hypothetical protein
VLKPQPDKAVVLLEIQGELPHIGSWQSFKNWVKKSW